MTQRLLTARLLGVSLCLLVLLSLPWQPTSFAAESQEEAPPAMTPERIGITRHLETGQKGARIETWKSKVDGASTRIHVDGTGRFETIEVYSSGGALLQRKEFRATEFVIETFRPSHTRTVLRGLDPGHTEETQTLFLPSGKTQTTIRILLNQEAWTQASCALPTPSAWIVGKVDEMSRTTANVFTFGNYGADPTGNEGGVYVGYNMVAHSCGGYPGGIRGLTDDLNRAVNMGVNCLTRHGSERRRDAEQLLAFMMGSQSERILSDRTRIYCAANSDQTITSPTGRTLGPVPPDAIAIAYTCPAAHPPAMGLNLSRLASESPDARRGTLFHEMLHWLNYRHSEGKDVTYLAQYCCFDSGQSELDRARSCQLLAAPDDDWDSAARTTFGRIVARNRRPSIAVDAGWDYLRSTLKSPRTPDPAGAWRRARSACLTLPSTFSHPMSLEGYRDTGVPFSCLALSRAAAQAAGDENPSQARLDLTTLNNRYFAAEGVENRMRAAVTVGGRLGHFMRAPLDEVIPQASSLPATLQKFNWCDGPDLLSQEKESIKAMLDLGASILRQRCQQLDLEGSPRYVECLQAALAVKQACP